MQDNNPIVYLGRLHKILFLWPVVLSFVALWVGWHVNPLREAASILFLLSLGWGIMTWVTYRFSSLTIKQKQIILCTGMLVRKTIDIPLTKIESIDIRQSLFGSIFRYGSLVVTGTGGTRHPVNYLAKPLTCRRHIEQLMHG